MSFNPIVAARIRTQAYRPMPPKPCSACNGTGHIRIDTSEAYEPYWHAGDVVTVDCPYRDEQGHVMRLDLN